MTYSEIKDLIISHHLKPSTYRELPLLTVCIITQTYTKLLRESLKFSYDTLVFIGGKDFFYFMCDDDRVIKLVGELIKTLDSEERLLEEIIRPQRKYYERIESDFLSIEARQDFPADLRSALRELVILITDYVLVLGIHNCFWRYVGQNQKSGLSESTLKEISSSREYVAKLYPRLENVQKKYAVEIGRREGFDGDLLRYLTYHELMEEMKKHAISQEMLAELERRRERYLYWFLDSEDKEGVITDPDIVNQVFQEFYSVSKDIGVIAGHSAYKGLVRGKVLNLKTCQKLPDILPEQTVLVTNMTHPDLIGLIKQSVAIVTDEGGVLCHAAVVSRELKKPCIIGTKIATQVLKDGMMVQVDAEKGEVKIIKAV